MQTTVCEEIDPTSLMVRHDLVTIFDKHWYDYHLHQPVHLGMNIAPSPHGRFLFVLAEDVYFVAQPGALKATVIIPPSARVWKRDYIYTTDQMFIHDDVASIENLESDFFPGEYNDMRQRIMKDPNAIRTLDCEDGSLWAMAIDLNPTLINWVPPHLYGLQLNTLKYHPEYIQYVYHPREELQHLVVQIKPTLIQCIQHPTDSVQSLAIRQLPHCLQYIRRPSEYIIELALSLDLSTITWIPQPSLIHQFKVVRAAPEAIQFINNPHHDVKQYVLQKDGHNIRFLRDPSEYYQLLAVQHSLTALLHIDQPTEVVQRYVLSQDMSLLQYMPRVSAEIQLWAVQTHAENIRFILYPSKDVQLHIARHAPQWFHWIREPTFVSLKTLITYHPQQFQTIQTSSPELMEHAVRMDPQNIRFISQPTEDLWDLAITNDPRCILYLENPSLARQLQAVKQDGTVIAGIDNPTWEVMLAAIRQNPQALLGIHRPWPYALMKLALQQDGDMIQYLPRSATSSFAVQKYALQNSKHGHAYPWLVSQYGSSSLAWDLQYMAVRRMPRVLKYIPQPDYWLDRVAAQNWKYSDLPPGMMHQPLTQEMIDLLVQASPHALKYLPSASITVEMEWLALKSFPEAIRWIKSPTYAMKRWVVHRDGEAIRYITSPSYALQRIAVEQNSWAIVHITHPHDRILQLALKKNPLLRDKLNTQAPHQIINKHKQVIDR
jgi:hypothetical protein